MISYPASATLGELMSLGVVSSSGGGAAVPDTTAPTLSAPTGTQTGQTTATVGVTTNEAGGTLYFFVSNSATPPAAAALKAGTGAVTSGSQVVSATGAQSVNLVGLTASTTYYTHWLHRDAAGNDSTIVSGTGFTTATSAPTLGTLTLSGTLTTGTASTGTIIGATTASTITSTVTGLTVNSGARTYSWDGTGAAGTTANGLVETLAGATGSPKDNSVTVVAGAALAKLYGVGDSIMDGSASQGGGHHFMAQLGFGAGVTISNIAVSGQTLATELTNALAGNVTIASSGPTVVAVEGGTNDMGANSTTATALYDIARQVIELYKSMGAYVAISTLLPRSDASWSPAKETERLAYNTLIRANSAGADVIVDWASDSLIGDTADTNATTYYFDKLHLNAAGQDQAAVVWAAALDPLVRTAKRPLSAPPALSLASRAFGSGQIGNALTAGSGTVYSGTVPYSGLAKPFTVECWFKTSATSLKVLFGQKNGGGTGWYVALDAAGKFVIDALNGTDQSAVSASAYNDNVWHHGALVMSATDMKGYVDGVLVATLGIVPAGINGALTLGIYGGSFAWTGAIDGFAIFNGARYTGTFTPPAAAYTSSEINLLAYYPLDSGSSGVGPPLPTIISPLSLVSMTYGSAKFGTGRATGYASVPSDVIPVAGLARPNTIECWFSTSAASLQVIFGQKNGGSNSWYVALNAAGNLYIEAINGTTQNIASAGSYKDGVLHHLAIVTSTTNIKGYVDGVLVATLGIVPAVINGAFWLGAYAGPFGWSGVFDEFAIFSGIRYTGTFIPPTVAYTTTEPNLLALYHLDGNGLAA